MSFTITTDIEYVAISCGACGCQFAMTETFHAERRKSHATWYCPNGHPRVYTAQTDAEKLRDEKTRLLAQLDQERAAKATLERKLARVEKGTCPHCSRSFTNLARHMKSKHGETCGKKKA